MKCPYCGEVDSKVIDSRPTEDGEKIRRRRECLNCKKRFTTYEIVETVPLMVVKKDRSREVFDRQKLLNGMLRACEKRPVSYTQLDAAVDRIEQQLLNSYDREVSSIHIGGYAGTQADGRCRLRALCLCLPPVQRRQHLHGRTEGYVGQPLKTRRKMIAAPGLSGHRRAASPFPGRPGCPLRHRAAAPPSSGSAGR